MSDVEATIRAYFDGINSERYDDVGRLFAPDGELRAPGTPVRRGAQDIADYFRAALKPYPEHDDDPTRIIVAGNTVTVEIHYSGRLDNGARVEFDAIDVFDLDDDARIVRLSSWYDSHGVRKMLRAAREQTV